MPNQSKNTGRTHVPVDGMMISLFFITLKSNRQAR